MIIQSSNVGMNSRHVYRKSEAAHTSLQVWGGRQNTSMTNGIAVTLDDKSRQDEGSGNSFSGSMSDIFNRFQSTQRVNAPQISDVRNTFHKMQADTLSFLLRLLFGDNAALIDKSDDTSFVTNANQQFGGHYESSYSYCEEEYTSFDDTTLSDEKIKYYNTIVQNSINASSKILRLDYFKNRDFPIKYKN